MVWVSGAFMGLSIVNCMVDGLISEYDTRRQRCSDTGFSWFEQMLVLLKGQV